MLPAAHRLRTGRDFSAVVRGGRKAGTRRVVVHAATTDADPPRVGFVVSKAVGGAVVRNRVKRRLRHLMSVRLSELPPGTDLVIRALRASSASSSAELRADLDDCLRRVTGRGR